MLTGAEQDTFEEAEASFRSQIKILEDEVARYKVAISFPSTNYPELTPILPCTAALDGVYHAI
jgi:hypothetical protein